MAERTRCKFVCESAEKVGQQTTVRMRAQYESPNSVPEDQQFTKYTPWGTLEFGVENPALDGFFQPGKAYYLDITPAE